MTKCIEPTETLPLSAIGGIDHDVFQRMVVLKDIFVLTHYTTDIAILVPYPVTDEVAAKCQAITRGDNTPRVKALKTRIRDKIWSGEILGVRLGRTPNPVALVIPIGYDFDEA